MCQLRPGPPNPTSRKRKGTGRSEWSRREQGTQKKTTIKKDQIKKIRQGRFFRITSRRPVVAEVLNDDRERFMAALLGKGLG